MLLGGEPRGSHSPLVTARTNSSTVTVRAAVAEDSPRPPPLEGEQGAHEHVQHGAAEPMIVGERVAQPMRKRQHPLADAQIAEDAVDKVGVERAHAPATARGTEPGFAAGNGAQRALTERASIPDGRS